MKPLQYTAYYSGAVAASTETVIDTVYLQPGRELHIYRIASSGIQAVLNQVKYRIRRGSVTGSIIGSFTTGAFPVDLLGQPFVIDDIGTIVFTVEHTEAIAVLDFTTTIFGAFVPNADR